MVRAYSSSAAENLSGADVRALEMCKEFSITVDYTGVDSIGKYFAANECNQLSVDYGERVTFLVAVKKADKEKFQNGLIDFMQGKVTLEEGAEYYAPFSV